MAKFIKMGGKKDKGKENIKRCEKSWQAIVIINDLAIYLTFLVSKAKTKIWSWLWLS